MEIFKGLKIVELAGVLAGPSVGQFFAELGAQVIKVENPATGGDVTRSWKLPSETAADGISAYFSSVNWGKSSLLADLGLPADRARVAALIAGADIVLASYKKGDAEKLGMDYQSLKAANPNLIYGQINGYGTDSPKVGYDAIIQAEAGFMYMNGEKGGGPVKMPVALIDVLAAHQLKEALLIALYRRLRDGCGSLVSVSLFESALSALSNQGANYLVAGHIPQRMGSEHPNIVPYGSIFETIDGGQIVLAVGTDKQFAALCRFLGLEGLPHDPRFAKNPDRVKHKADLLPLIASAIACFEKEVLLQGLEKANVPAGAVNNVAEALESPLAEAFLLIDPQTGRKGLRQIAADFDGIGKTVLAGPPALGEGLLGF